MAKEDCNRLSLTNWIALVTVTVLVLGSAAGFVSHLVTGTETRVLKAIETVDKKIEKVDSKLDKHIDFHLTNKLQCNKEDVDAEENETEEIPSEKSERQRLSWRGEVEGKKTETVRN